MLEMILDKIYLCDRMLKVNKEKWIENNLDGKLSYGSTFFMQTEANGSVWVGSGPCGHGVFFKIYITLFLLLDTKND